MDEAEVALDLDKHYYTVIPPTFADWLAEQQGSGSGAKIGHITEKHLPGITPVLVRPWQNEQQTVSVPPVQYQGVPLCYYPPGPMYYHPQMQGQQMFIPSIGQQMLRGASPQGLLPMQIPYVPLNLHSAAINMQMVSTATCMPYMHPFGNYQPTQLMNGFAQPQAAATESCGSRYENGDGGSQPNGAVVDAPVGEEKCSQSPQSVLSTSEAESGSVGFTVSVSAEQQSESTAAAAADAEKTAAETTQDVQIQAKEDKKKKSSTPPLVEVYLRGEVYNFIFPAGGYNTTWQDFLTTMTRFIVRGRIYFQKGISFGSFDDL